MTKQSGHQNQRAPFDEAAVATLAILDDGEWHKSTAEIRETLRPWVQEHMFGKVKSRYKIEHCRIGIVPGSYYEWRRLEPPEAIRVRYGSVQALGVSDLAPSWRLYGLGHRSEPPQDVDVR